MQPSWSSSPTPTARMPTASICAVSLPRIATAEAARTIMRIIATDLPDVFIIEMKAFTDDRGFIKELWNAPRYLNHGLGVPSVQTNFSRSRKDVVRGLHYQEPHGQGKLVTVVAGEVFDVAVDIRK